MHCTHYDAKQIYDVLTFDVPGATMTDVHSIDAKDEIVNAFEDANEVTHGVVGIPLSLKEVL